MRTPYHWIAGDGSHGTVATIAGRAVFLGGVALAAAILLRFYDRMWVPHDDGYYAHIADRILQGAVLHRDVQALHPGYVYFVNALSLRLFGPDLVSLRYPLVALGVVQAALVGALFLRHSAVMAATAAVLFTSLSYVLFPTPSVHWYCLFLLVLIVCAAEWIPRHSPWRPFVLGVLVGVLGLFRQLTGAFVGIGVLAYLLAEPGEVQSGGDPETVPGRSSSPGPRRTAPVARWLVGASALLVAAYCLTKGSPLARGLFGVWAPLVAALAAWRAARSAGAVRRPLLLLAAGAAVAAVPLLAYQLVHHSLGDWFNDSVVSAVTLSELEYVQVRRYAEMLRRAARQVVRPEGLRPVLSGGFWLVLMLAPAALGLAVARDLVRARGTRRWPHPLPFLATFYAPVALHFEAPAYVFFAAAPVACGLLFLVAERAASPGQDLPQDGRGGPPLTTWQSIRGQARPTSAAAVLVAALVSYAALRYQAAQPASRGHMAAVAGQRTALVYAEGIDGVGLRISGDDIATYSEILGLIRRHTGPTDAILSVPGGAEFQFLSGRRNPLPYPYVVYGVMDDGSLERALSTLRKDPPALVIHAPSLSYNTPHTDRLVNDLRAHSTLIATVRQFNVYKRNLPTTQRGSDKGPAAPPP